jgi:hypothetical protein
VSPTADAGARKDAAQFGAGAHIMYVDESNFPECDRSILPSTTPLSQPILGLEQAEFTLREDGKPVAITAFVGAGGGATSTALVIDQSGSMGDEDKMGGAIRAAQGYMDFLNRWARPARHHRLQQLEPDAGAARCRDRRRACTLLRGLLGALFPLAGTEFYAATHRRGQAARMASAGGAWCSR